ncbi:anti-sigma factor family protein [Parerythrobacter aestuarii]|uniref:anti-sigma factor family protein n=1 Tax=Parerythrobacter aestuarii TaxID=3020909 RepID=UPI0024DEADA2|nr:hypothetical protein [Parerythrobacter aestuarii]
MTSAPDRIEQIAAFLDGAMSDSEAEAFERAMADDPQLAEEVERIAGNDALLREAFALPADDGLDAGLLERMGLADRDMATTPVSALPPLPANDNPPFWRRWQVPLGGAIAAGLALALTMTLMGSGTMSPIGSALEQTPSGQIAHLKGDTAVTPLLTFQSGDGRYCREFNYANSGRERSGIACRGQADWTVEAWGEGAAAIPDPSEIALASGAAEGSLDATYQRLAAGDPLAMTLEKSLISGGWKKSP